MASGSDSERVRRFPLILVACLTLLLCTSLVVRGDTADESVTERAHAYGSAPRQQLVAYRDRSAPREESARRPGVIILHGGFWFHDRPSGWNAWAQRIADSGVAVFDVDYRRSIDAPWPAQRSDVLRALSWIRQRAGIFGVDPHRIVLLGSSAGGQLATSVGTYGAGRRHVAGVIGLSPVVDPYRAWRDGAGRTGERGRGLTVLRASAAVLAGCEPRRGAGEGSERCRGVWRDMSAARHATGSEDAPMLLIHSRRDFVPVAHSEDLRGAERGRGMAAGDITVVTVPGAVHGGALMTQPGVAPRVLDWIAERTRGPAHG